MTTEVSDDSELAWDEFVPDSDDIDADDEDEEEAAAVRARAHARASGLEVGDEEEDLELAQEDLELRWDAFEGEDRADDPEDAAAAADAARIAAALERMERRVMGLEDEPADADVVAPVAAAAVHDVSHDASAGDLTGDQLTGDQLTGDQLTGEREDVADDVALGGATVAGVAAYSDPASGETDATSQAPMSTEDRMRVEAAFARMEEALFGDSNEEGEDAQAAIYEEADGEEEPEWLLEGEYATVACEEEDYEVDGELSVAAGPAYEEPEAWLEDEDAGESAPAAAAWSQDRVPVHTEFADDAVTLDEGAVEDEVEDDSEDEAAVGTHWRDPESAAVASSAYVQTWDDGTDEDDEADRAVVVEGALAASALTGEPLDAEPIVIPADLSELDDSLVAHTNEAGDGAAATRYLTRTRGRERAHTAHAGSDVRRMVLLACLFFAVAIGAAVLRFGHIHSNSAPPATAATPAASSSASIARLESAITDVQSASSGAQAGLTTLSVFPTPPRIATIMNPYVDSLQLYETLASSVEVPKAARTAASTADLQVHQDISFLGTINGLPAIQLGSFIDGFFARSTQLQSTMDALQHALNPAS